MNLTPEELQKQILIKRELRLRKSRDSFWEFCRTQDPDLYSEDKWHLHLDCVILQALYEKKLTKKFFKDAVVRIAPEFFYETINWGRLKDTELNEDGEVIPKVYDRLIQNLPPRHGKSRTLVLFCEWCMGKNQKNRVITCSYGDDLAMSFSRFVRDGIMQEKTYPTEICFNDIFPSCVVKHGDSSYQKWALEGQFFNYKGAGVNGAITGMGCNIAIVDDPVKDASEAVNTDALKKIWDWYTGTFMSRREEGGIEIVNMTRWATHDVCGELLSGEEADEWLIYSVEAMYELETGEVDEEGKPVMKKTMIAPKMLSLKRYFTLAKTLLPEILKANYHQKPIDIKGRLYPEFKTYTCLPVDGEGNTLTERIIAYIDTADEGKDHLAGFAGHVYEGEIFITHIIYTKAGMQFTEPQTAKMLADSQAHTCKIESNNGGRGFARNVDRLLRTLHKHAKCSISWFYQSKNKVARILTNSTYVIDHIYFPVGWEKKHPELAKDLYAYQKEGGPNQVDDGPDALTGLAEIIIDGDYMGLIDWMKRQIEKGKDILKGSKKED